MKKMKYIIYMLVVMFATTSCEDFLNITPEGQSKRDEQLSTVEGIEDAMYGVYSQLRSTTLYGQELYYQSLEVMAHNLYCHDNDAIEALGRFEYNNTDVKSLFEAIWTAMYKNISNVNSVLDAPLVKEAKEFPYTIYRGEALGLRAFMHFDLVRLYAEQYTLNPKANGIPYATEFSLKTPDFESLEKNYEHILADLLEADSLLANEDEYEGVSNYMLDRQIHFNRYAVQATLARVYMTMGNKEKAVEYAKKAIANNGKYMLKEKTEVKDDLAGVLSRKECLFGVYYKNYFSLVNAKLQQMSFYYSLEIRKDFKEIYENENSNGDYRTTAYFSELRLSDSDIRSRLCKFTDIYELNNNSASRPADLILGINMIRIPEMYYIVAEALMETEPQNALAYFNAVREHRGLKPFGEEQKLDAAALNEEFFKEYIGEGQVFFNMKRQNLDIISFDGGTTYKASNNIYTVPIPDVEKEHRY